MRILTTVREMQLACRNLKRKGTLGMVPTMGALHEGHLSLVRRAQGECDAVVVSIFVNPTQFAAGEDYETYPRTFDDDCAKLEAAGVDLLFAPGPDEMYSPGSTTFVEVPGIGDRLDGASRPGHFCGVATVVAKLFNIVSPQRAYFGQKDAAQIAVLRAMIRDLDFPIELVACPIVREPDGLAMSSRNRYLSPQNRGRALILHQALQTVCQLLESGETRSNVLQRALLSVFAGQEDIRLDYAAIVDPYTLLPVADTARGALIAVAAWVGSTRLIDNILTENLPIENLNLQQGWMEETHA
ncbi:pantoate--beta-alanine ligase [Granulicella sp. L46]|uniref:pantoate--beta-alanine ligase n=1 Tax=Granulicella sp. L46 TaxID=1641865 RepID=UPI00131DA701|nr:pantoate--beta-alanine ligase [Granulicella sp. L46]